MSLSIHKGLVVLSLITVLELRWSVVIDINTRGGYISQPIQIEYERRGYVDLSLAELRLLVCPGAHLISGPIELTSCQLEGYAIIGDAFPGVGVAFEKFDIGSTLIESAFLEEVKQATASKVAGAACKVVERYRLSIKGRKLDRDAIGHIEVIPESSKYPSLFVPVYFRATETSKDKQGKCLVKSLLPFFLYPGARSFRN